MSLNEEELEQHCRRILEDRKVRNKILVLCEGEIRDVEGRPSPQAYRKLEQMPDTNFYRACIPVWWRHNIPVFRNCGNRKNVIDAYSMLKELHKQAPENSCLNPSKLFAIVDLDIQSQTIENYTFSCTETIFQNLYQALQVNEAKADQHRIWVTGLIHKEAYFFMPYIQTVFSENLTVPLIKGNPILLRDLYMSMCDELDSDTDLKTHFQRISDRIKFCSEINCKDIEQFKESWIGRFQCSPDTDSINKLVCILLAIKKVKQYWQQVEPDDSWSSPSERFREQLTLRIGTFYSQQACEPQYHIPSFFNFLRNFQ